MDSNNFYSTEPEKTLRFGDIVKGFPTTYVDINDSVHFDVSLGHPSYSVVITPCCSIRDKVLSLCKLKPLDKKYFKASKIEENPLLLNKKILAEDSIPTGHWNNMSDEEKKQRQATGYGYAFNSVFIFAPASQLPLNESKSYYEIDFRESCCIKSESIKSPNEPINLVDKILELSEETRGVLLDKLQDYYARVISS